MKVKKIFPIFCATALAASMSMSAFAAEGTTKYEDLEQAKQSQHTVTVNATVEELGTVYSVNVAWTDLAFTYSEETPASWDATQHKVNATKGTWSAGGEGNVTVTNNSNVAVYAKITYAADGDYTTNLANKGVTVETTDVATATQLKAGDENNVTPQAEGDYQNQIKATVTVSGTPTATIEDATAGTFTAVVGTTASLD